MERHSGEKSYFQVLDSLRGIAAIMVALFHIRTTGHLEDLRLIRNSWLFVDFFFVLSGFVIAANYSARLRRAEVSVTEFAARRFARLYPLHIVMLALFVLTEVILSWVSPSIGFPYTAFKAHRSLGLLPENIFLLQSFGITGYLSWNGVAWSISAEFWTYIVYALSLVGASILLIAFRMFSLLIVPFAILILNDGSLALQANGGFFRCLMGFFLGTLLWQIYGFREICFLSSGWVEIPAFIIMCLFLIYSVDLDLTLLAPAIFATVIIIFSREQGVISRLLLDRRLLFLGTISYSIYMTHTYVFSRVEDVAKIFGMSDGRRIGNGPWQGDAFVVLTLGLTVFFSWMTWSVVEKPGQKAVLKFFGDRVLGRINKKGRT